MLPEVTYFESVFILTDGVLDSRYGHMDDAHLSLKVPSHSVQSSGIQSLGQTIEFIQVFGSLGVEGLERGGKVLSPPMK